MIVIPPITITPAMLTSSTVPYPDSSRGETAWTIASYAVDAERVSNQRIYTCVQAHSGRTSPPESDGAYWKEKCFANRYAMFDTLRTTKTVAASPLTVVITPGQRIDAIALLGCAAYAAQISEQQGATTIYDKTLNMVERETKSWYEYFFRKFSLRENDIRFDLPPVSNGVVTVTFTNPTGTVEVGGLVMGMQEYLGVLEFSPVNDATNYSKIERSAIDGTATILQRRNVPQTSQTIIVDRADVNRVRRLRDSLNAVPAVYCGLDEDSSHPYYQSVLIYGIYRRMPINLANPAHARINLELEEL